ncbi:MAG: ribose-phosphate pyrophosphokinase [Lentisphaerae bacterium]|nr:ribose-phosphate pyrophosphokinase [Lentisphaerota bacterium]
MKKQRLLHDTFDQHFITPEKASSFKSECLQSSNGWLLFVACNSGIDLAASVKREYDRQLMRHDSCLQEVPLVGTHDAPITSVFSDTETCPRLPEHVAGSNAFVFQSIQENLSGNTVNENIQQLLQVVRTLRAHRAKNITVVTPYSPYSRQDKPTFMKRESALASLFADQLKIAGADMYFTYHPHTYGLYGFYEPVIKLVALSGLDLLVEMFARFKDREDVIAVSTDAGGAKFAVYYAGAMNIAHAIATKFRRAQEESTMLGIVGPLENKKVAIVIDDETVTGGSILDTVKALHEVHGIKEIYVAVSHLKVKKEYLPGFLEAHEKYGLKEVHVTDTIPQIPDLLGLSFLRMHSLAALFAMTINRLHYNQSISRVFSAG